MIHLVSIVQTWVTLIKDILTALTIPVTAIVAIRSLNTWRRQLKGNAEFELARMILRAVYKVRDTINFMRSPFFSAGEIAQAKKDAIADESGENVLVHDDLAVWQSRFNKIHEALSELDIAAIEAEAMWGSDIRVKIKLMNHPVASLNSAKNALARLKHQPESRQKYDDRIDKYENIIFQMGTETEPDEFEVDMLVVV